MEVILLQNVKNLGGLGEKVSVRPGYGRNFLIPQGLALPATKTNLEVFEARRAELEKHATDVLTRAQARAQGMEGLSLTISARVSDETKLYGSVGPQEIEKAAEALGVELHKSEIDMPEGPIHEIGEYHVVAQLHAEVQVQVTVLVEAETA
mgnify:CR=1 FL=1